MEQQPIQIQTRTNTEPIPIPFSFSGTSDDLLKAFYKKVKPIEGIIKYKLIWNNFPIDITQAKELAKSWSKCFSENSKYDGLFVNIYFHLTKKTIRFEIKKFIRLSEFIFEPDEQFETIEQCKDLIFMRLSETCGIYKYKLRLNIFPNLQNCKNLAREWASQIETLYPNNKCIIFFNYSSSIIKITMSLKQ